MLLKYYKKIININVNVYTKIKKNSKTVAMLLKYYKKIININVNVYTKIKKKQQNRSPAVKVL